MRVYSLVVLLIMPGFILRDGGCGPNDLPLNKESLESLTESVAMDL